VPSFNIATTLYTPSGPIKLFELPTFPDNVSSNPFGEITLNSSTLSFDNTFTDTPLLVCRKSILASATFLSVSEIFNTITLANIINNTFNTNSNTIPIIG